MVDTKTNKVEEKTSKQEAKSGKANTRTNKKDTRTNKKGVTTIKLQKQTKERLEHLKEHERETYEQVIKKILYILNRIRKDPVSANRLLSRIDNSIKRKAVYNKKQKEHEIKEVSQLKESPKIE